MYDSITGKIVRKDPSVVVLRTGGIGYSLSVPRRIAEALPDSGEATLFCHLAVRDDSMKLFGFESVDEREIFRRLNSVSGVGAVTALLILSEFSPLQVIETILAEKDLLFRKVKGVGTKTAKRIVLELKGKVEGMALTLGAAAGESTEEEPNRAHLGEDLLATLVGLGFSRAQARETAIRTLAENPGEENLEKLIKASLALLSS
jgi:holliday junction DNA helicase RuvA